MMRASIRLLTAIALIAMSGLSVAQGWRIVHFSLATMNIDSSEKRAEITNTWRAVPGLASKALQADLTDEINPSDVMVAYRRREVLSELLSIKPLSSMDWLSLSGMQLVTDQPMEQVLGSLKLSAITGPNEGYVMTERASFRRFAMGGFVVRSQEPCGHDLGPMIFPRTPAEGAEHGKFRAVLSTKPEWVRNELRKALLATGVCAERDRTRLDFSFAAER